MTVGAGINFTLLFENFGSIIGLTIGLILLKVAILLILARIFKIKGGDKWLFSLGLAQAGEFGFVLLSFTVANQVIPTSVADNLLLIVALSMLLTPGLFILYERVILPRYEKEQEEEADEIDEKGDIIIAGHGRFGGMINRMLRTAGYTPTVLDYSAEQLETLRPFGLKVFFGDASRPDLLHAAGIEEAKLLVIAIDNKDQITEMVHYVTSNHPHVHVIARAIDRTHVYDLYAAGCRDIIRDVFDSSVRAGRSAFEAMGMHPFDAEKAAQEFVVDDRRLLVEMAEVYDPSVPNHLNEPLVQKTKEIIEEMDAKIYGSGHAFNSRLDKGWMPPNLKDVKAAEDDNA
jgi:CPA2 family monovalent cation:H+ antiporter-2